MPNKKRKRQEWQVIAEGLFGESILTLLYEEESPVVIVFDRKKHCIVAIFSNSLALHATDFQNQTKNEDTEVLVITKECHFDCYKHIFEILAKSKKGKFEVVQNADKYYIRVGGKTFRVFEPFEQKRDTFLLIAAALCTKPEAPVYVKGPRVFIDRETCSLADTPENARAIEVSETAISKLRDLGVTIKFNVSVFQNIVVMRPVDDTFLLSPILQVPEHV